MAYKPHSLFTHEAKEAIDKRLPAIKDTIRQGLLTDIVYLSRMGLLPEGNAIPAESAIQHGEAMKKVFGSQILPFCLGSSSMSKLNGVHPRLRDCIELAITISEVDFRVGETERSVSAQKANVAKGVSRTMKSKHFKQPVDGFVWAADLIALDEHKAVTWNPKAYTEIAHAMDQAATKLGIAGHIRWGAAWDRVLSDFGGSRDAYEAEAEAYAKRHAGSDLIDMPHFEWVA